MTNWYKKEKEARKKFEATPLFKIHRRLRILLKRNQKNLPQNEILTFKLILADFLELMKGGCFDMEVYEGICECGFRTTGMSKYHVQALIGQHKRSSRNHKERMELLDWAKKKLESGEPFEDKFTKKTL